MTETAELFTCVEAAKRQGVHRQTISAWRRKGWLVPAAEKPYRYTAGALDAAAAIRAEEATKTAGSFAALPEGEKIKRRAQLSQARKKMLERYRLKEGEGGTADAARWAGVGGDAIRTAYRNGELPAASINPLRFDRDVVKRWASTQAKGDNDLSIHEVVAMLPGRPGKVRKTGISEKYDRVRGIIRQNEMGYQRRTLSKQKRNRNLTCIAKERFAELKEMYLDLTGEDEDLLPGEITICDAAKQYKFDQSTLSDRLAKHAPSAIRKVKLGRRGRYSGKVRVAPITAIEAALRGEDWAPPGESTNGEPREPAGKESDGTSHAKPDSELPDLVAASKRVQLFGPDCLPVIDGEAMPKKLTKARYTLVLQLILASNEGRRLSKDDLGGDDVANPFQALKGLVKSHPKWESVIEFAGEKGRGYSIK